MFPVKDPNSILTIELFDWDQLDKNDFLGIIKQPIQALTEEAQGVEELCLKLGKRSKKSTVTGVLNIILEWHRDKSPDEVVCLISEEKILERRREQDKPKDLISKVTNTKLNPIAWVKNVEKRTPGLLYVNAMEAKFNSDQLALRTRDKHMCCMMLIEDLSLLTEPKPGPKPKWTQGNTVFRISDKASELKIYIYEGNEVKKHMLIAKGKVSITHLTKEALKQWCELSDAKSKEPSVMVRVNWRFEVEGEENTPLSPRSTVGTLDLEIISARNLSERAHQCVVTLEGSEFYHTNSIVGSTPDWNEQVKIPIGSVNDLNSIIQTQ